MIYTHHGENRFLLLEYGDNSKEQGCSSDFVKWRRWFLRHTQVTNAAVMFSLGFV